VEQRPFFLSILEDLLSHRAPEIVTLFKRLSDECLWLRGLALQLLSCLCQTSLALDASWANMDCSNTRSENLISYRAICTYGSHETEIVMVCAGTGSKL
jgi:hypothetical protein